MAVTRPSEPEVLSLDELLREETSKPEILTLEQLLAPEPGAPPAVAEQDTFTVPIRPEHFAPPSQPEGTAPAPRPGAVELTGEEPFSISSMMRSEVERAKEMGLVRYAAQGAGRGVTSFAQSFVDPVIGLVNIATGNEFVYATAPDDKAGSIVMHAPPADFDLARNLEKMGVFQQATVLDKVMTVGGHAAGFATSARMLGPLTNLAKEASLRMGASAAAAGASSFATEAAGLTVMSMLSQASVSGRDAITSPEAWFESGLYSIGFPILARSGGWIGDAAKKYANRDIGRYSRRVISDGLAATAGGVASFAAAKGSPDGARLTQAEGEALISEMAGMFLGFQGAAAAAAIFPKVARARTNRGAAHQTDLALKAYEERALYLDKPLPSHIPPETAAAIRRSRARAYYETARTRISGPITVKPQDLVRLYGVTKKEARRIVSERISDAEAAEIHQSRLNEGVLAMIEERKPAIERAGVNPDFVRWEAMRDLGILDPVTKANYEQIRAALETSYPARRIPVTEPVALEGTGKVKLVREQREVMRAGVAKKKKGPVKAVAQESELARIQKFIPKLEEVRTRSQDPAFESSIDGLIDAGARGDIASMERDLAAERTSERQRQFGLAEGEQREQIRARRETLPGPGEPGLPTAARRAKVRLPVAAERGEFVKFRESVPRVEPGEETPARVPRRPVEDIEGGELLTPKAAEQLGRRGREGVAGLLGEESAPPAPLRQKGERGGGERIAGPFPDTVAGRRRAEQARTRLGDQLVLVRGPEGVYVARPRVKVPGTPRKPGLESMKGGVARRKQLATMENVRHLREAQDMIDTIIDRELHSPGMEGWRMHRYGPQWNKVWKGVLARKEREAGVRAGEGPTTVRSIEMTMKILGERGTLAKKWLDPAKLEQKPLDPKGILAHEWQTRGAAENAAKRMAKIGQNALFQFRVESMTVDPATGKETGPWKVAVGQTPVQNIYDALNIDGLPPDMKKALSDAEQRRLDSQEDTARALRGVPLAIREALEAYLKDGGLPIVALGMTAAGVATLAGRDEDEVGAGLAALPFFLRFRRKGQSQPMSPFEKTWAAKIDAARAEATRTKIANEQQAYVERLKSGSPGPREIERSIEELHGKAHLGEGGIEAFEHLYEAADGTVHTLSGPQYRRAIDKGAILRRIQEWEPTWREKASMTTARAQTGLGLRFAATQQLTTGFGVAMASAGAALARQGPFGEFLSLGAHDAVNNQRMRSSTLMEEFVQLPWRQTDVDMSKPLNVAEEVLLHELLEAGVKDRPPLPMPQQIEDALTPKNREKVRAVAEFMQRTLTGEKGKFWKATDSDAVEADITTMENFWQLRLADVWREARAREIVHDDFGFLNPGGGYFPVLFRPEVHFPKPRTDITGIGGGIVGATVGSIAGALAGGDDEETARGLSLAGGLVGGAMGLKLGLRAGSRDYATATRWRDAIADNAVERGLYTTDALTLERRPMTREDALNILDGYGEGRYNGLFAMPLKHKSTTEVGLNRAQFLEKSRLLDVLVGRDLNPYSVLPKYFDAAYKRVEMARVFGAHYELAEEILSAAAKAGHNTEPARDIFDAITGSNRWLNEAKSLAFVDAFARPAVTLKLGLASIAQTASWTKTAAHTNNKSFVKQWWRTKEEIVANDPYWSKLLSTETKRKLMDKLARMEVAETGAALQSEYAHYMMSHGRSFFTRSATAFMQYNEMMPLDRIGRFHGALAGRDTMRRLRAQYEAALRAGDRAWAERKFEPIFRELLTTRPAITKRGKSSITEEFDQHWVALAMKGKLSPLEHRLLLARAGSNVVARASGRNEPIDLPIASQHPLFRHNMTLQTFAFRMGAETFNHMQRVIRLALDGKPAEAMKMVAKMAATTAAVYYGQRAVVRAIKQRDEDDGWFDAWADAAGMAGWFSPLVDGYREVWAERFGDFDIREKAFSPGPASEEMFRAAESFEALLRGQGNPALKLWLLDNVPEPARSMWLKDMREDLREDAASARREHQEDKR